MTYFKFLSSNPRKTGPGFGSKDLERAGPGRVFVASSHPQLLSPFEVFFFGFLDPITHNSVNIGLRGLQPSHLHIRSMGKNDLLIHVLISGHISLLLDFWAYEWNKFAVPSRVYVLLDLRVVRGFCQYDQPQFEGTAIGGFHFSGWFSVEFT